MIIINVHLYLIIIIIIIIKYKNKIIIKRNNTNKVYVNKYGKISPP